MAKSWCRATPGPRKAAANDGWPNALPRLWPNRPVARRSRGDPRARSRKNYGPVEAVSGINLDVREGEIFGLIGPDGAGKTTTFQILAGIMEATSGAVEVSASPRATRAPRRLPHPDVQPVSRSERHGKHPLRGRSAARAAARKSPSAATAICACSTCTASRIAWPDV